MWNTMNSTAGITLLHSSHSLLLRRFTYTKHLYSPIIPFKLADIGEGIADVKVLNWYVKEGDQIKQFQDLCQVESDKATVDITSRYDGIVKKLHYKVGENAFVGQALVDIEAKDVQNEEKLLVDTKELDADRSFSAEMDDSGTALYVGEKSSSESETDTLDKGRVNILTSPSVRRMAKDHNIDLKNVIATGPEGRIVKKDVLKYLDRGIVERDGETESIGDTRTRTRSSTLFGTNLSEDQIIPVTSVRETMLKTMNAALSVPHFMFADEINMDALHVLREDMKATASERGITLSFMPFVMKATSLALKQYPLMNSKLLPCESKIRLLAAHNISVAIDTPQGLLVPNVKNVETKNIMQIAQDLNRLQKLAESREITPADLGGGTFTISNIGSIGGTYMTPVLLVPQVAIGAIGKIQVLPRFDKSMKVIPTRIMNVSWSADHRVLDGATVARFSNLWKSYLENPTRMLAELA